MKWFILSKSLQQNVFITFYPKTFFTLQKEIEFLEVPSLDTEYFLRSGGKSKPLGTEQNQGGGCKEVNLILIPLSSYCKYSGHFVNVYSLQIREIMHLLASICQCVRPLQVKN